jgi:hypothetical protein
MFSRHMVKNKNTKPSTISTPMKGCRMRVHGPPPNSALRKNRLGWKKARPESAAAKNMIATNQWFMRVASR